MLVAEKYQIELGCAPCNEECGQSGFQNAGWLQRTEAQQFKEQIVRTLGPLPEGTELRAVRNPYEDMSYIELVYFCDAHDQEGLEFARMLENLAPMEWDEESKAKLQEAGYYEKLKENRVRDW